MLLDFETDTHVNIGNCDVHTTSCIYTELEETNSHEVILQTISQETKEGCSKKHML